MKRSVVIIGILLVVAFIIYRLFAGTYNSMVTADENVKGKWAQVENQYQQRMDLIPNLVNTVKGAAEFEKGTLTAVVEARASATQVKVDPDKLTPENIQKFQEAQGQLSTALGRLLMVTENYPVLKANQNFLELQATLEGTERRIAVARKDFNEAAQQFNTYIRKFPQTLLAGMFGFSPKGYFQSDKGANKAPEVKF
ncbi:MAG TPA: LemA family protein [Bacteroidia bacterium]|nr:LemA family protein [Bacteroidia bacterium]QQR94154.1 MAG: LemA family protein [Bacteroidota bacterium]MBP7713124.1 LemA family protein [Bacteroidia bacterium]MBP8668952.1 LemA family protein [Bacteroidia bacterium]HOZ81486.1 LemA family protein [Bacteroidia bacterium]